MLDFLSKIDVSIIIKEHILTLRVPDGNGDFRWSKVDLTLFYVLPVFVALFIVERTSKFSEDIYTLGISVFSIFAALLLTAQVAMFGIFRAERAASRNDVDVLLSQKKSNLIASLLVEVNANISYMILLSVFCVATSFSFRVFEVKGVMSSFIFFSSTLHFCITLLMLIRRTHLLFHTTYKET